MSYGATGNGTTDDTAAIQAAINAAAVSGGIVFFPEGTYKTVAGVTSTDANVSFKGTGRGSILKAGGSAVPLAITGQAFVEDMVFDGGGIAANAATQSVTTESSYPSLWKNVVWQNATGYQYVNTHCEDVLYLACETPGDESSPTTVPDSVQITTPTGAVRFVGCDLFGENSLNVQTVSYEGCTAGPFYNNGGPTGSLWAFHGGYLYDGGLNNREIFDTSTDLPSVSANGCTLVANSQASFANGNLASTSSITFTNCTFVQGSATGATINLLTASGAGSLTIVGGSVSVNDATTVNAFNGVSSPSTLVNMNPHCQGVTQYPSGPFTTPYNVLDDGSGNIQSGGHIQAGGLGVRVQNDGAVTFLTTGGGSLWGGSGVPASGLGSNGDVFFRTDTPGTANQRIYVKSAGTWTGIV